MTLKLLKQGGSIESRPVLGKGGTTNVWIGILTGDLVANRFLLPPPPSNLACFKFDSPVSFHLTNHIGSAFEVIQHNTLKSLIQCKLWCSELPVYICHLADAFIQSDIQEQLELSALLKGTLAYFSPAQAFKPETFWLLAQHS